MKFIEKYERKDEDPYEAQQQLNRANKVQTEFCTKTDLLLNYIEKTYLTGKWSLERRGKKIIERRKMAENPSMVITIIILGTCFIFLLGPSS